MIILAVFLFSIGLIGIFTSNQKVIKKNIYVYLMILGAAINFIYFSAFKQQSQETGQIIAVLVLILAFIQILLSSFIFNSHADIKLEKKEE